MLTITGNKTIEFLKKNALLVFFVILFSTGQLLISSYLMAPQTGASGIVNPAGLNSIQNGSFYSLMFLGWWMAGFLLVVGFVKLQGQKKLRLQHDALEEKFLDLEKHYKETEFELDTFLYKASHDLKGPLTTLDGICNVGSLDCKDEAAQEYFRLQKKVIHKMQLLLFRIVEIGDIRNHSVKRGEIKLFRLCKGVVRSMNRIEGFDKIKFEIAVDPKITLYSDVEMLEIAVDNVMKNAIQHANYSNKTNAEVRIWAEEQAQQYLINIKDNGEGIAPNLQERIFDMFFRGNNYFKGFGLGLYKSKIALRKLQGDIFLYKSDRNGSTF
ncbi:MAG: HAMP domain-containing sensor histidine kinase, partial [Bacteroidota bacterium]